MPSKRPRKPRLANATLTNEYSIVYRNDGKMRIVNAYNMTVFTIWGEKIISILTASDNVCKSIEILFPGSKKSDTKHHGNNKYIITIHNSSIDEVLAKCFVSYSGKYDKGAAPKDTDNHKSTKKPYIPSPEVINERDDLEEEIKKRHLKGEERNAYVKVRINQGEYRKLLLKQYKHCCLCKVSDSRLLIASHIMPWVDSDENEKVDMYNGLLLCPNHDRLFDQGFITFASDKTIIISDALSESDRVYMNVSEAMRVECKDECVKYLQYHRERIFEKKL